MKRSGIVRCVIRMNPIEFGPNWETPRGPAKLLFWDMEEHIKNSGHFFHRNPYVYETFQLEYLDKEKIFFSSVKKHLVHFQKFFNLSSTCIFDPRPPAPYGGMESCRLMLHLLF